MMTFLSSTREASLTCCMLSAWISERTRPGARSLSRYCQPTEDALRSAESAAGGGGVSPASLRFWARYLRATTATIAAIATSRSQRIPRMKLSSIYRAILAEAHHATHTHPRHRRHIRQGIQRTHGGIVLSADARRRHAEAGAVPGAGGSGDADDDRQPADDGRGPRVDSATMPGGSGNADCDHARDGHDGADGGGAGSGARRQDGGADGRDDSLYVRQFGRIVQFGDGARVCADAGSRGVCGDERAVLPVERGAEE